MTAPGLKYWPETVRFIAGLPAWTDGCERALIVSGVMVKDRLPESRPPGFATAIWAVPADVSSSAGTVAASWAACVRLVAISVCRPPGGVKRATEPFWKFVPAIDTAVAGLPTGVV